MTLLYLGVHAYTSVPEKWMYLNGGDESKSVHLLDKHPGHALQTLPGNGPAVVLHSSFPSYNFTKHDMNL